MTPRGRIRRSTEEACDQGWLPLGKEVQSVRHDQQLTSSLLPSNLAQSSLHNWFHLSSTFDVFFVCSTPNQAHQIPNHFRSVMILLTHCRWLDLFIFLCFFLAHGPLYLLMSWCLVSALSCCSSVYTIFCCSWRMFRNSAVVSYFELRVMASSGHLPPHDRK